MANSLTELGDIYGKIALAEAALESHLGVPICIPGCGKCCEITVAHRIEATYALSTIINTSKYKEIMSRAEKWLLTRHKGLRIYGRVNQGVQSKKLLKEFYTVVHLTCPFSEDDKTCLLYEGRPLVGRAYGVTRVAGPTATKCPRPLGKNETKLCRAYIDDPNLKAQINQWTSNLSTEDRLTGFFPAILYREAYPARYLYLSNGGRVASAKILGSQEYGGMLWQEQLDREWKMAGI